MKSRKAIFLDRDGVLNIDYGYTHKLSDLKLVPGAVDGLRKLHAEKFLFVMVTNQSGVARGMYSMADVALFHEALLKKINCEIPDFSFDAIMICPHLPDGKIAEFSISCACRKPGTKMIIDAKSQLNINLEDSWLIGDRDSDIDCAIASGVRGIQVVNGGKAYKQSSKAFAIVSTLNEAADIIIGSLS